MATNATLKTYLLARIDTKDLNDDVKVVGVFAIQLLRPPFLF
jgi:hypothetical protein